MINITRKTIKFMKSRVYIILIIRRFPLFCMCISNSAAWRCNKSKWCFQL